MALTPEEAAALFLSAKVSLWATALCVPLGIGIAWLLARREFAGKWLVDAAIQLLQTDVFQKNGVTRIGIAGHPEGNSDITKVHGEAVLLKALGEKQAWLKANNISGFIATQFLFEAAPVAYWASMLRENGIDLPIHVGIPGPATIKTLVKYAAMCGVGNSARFIRKQALNITKLLTVNTPDEFIEQLAVLHFDRPELGIQAPHLYPFGGFVKMFEWLSPKFKAGL